MELSAICIGVRTFEMKQVLDMSAKYDRGLAPRAATDAAQEAKRTNLRKATAGADGHGIRTGNEHGEEGGNGCRPHRGAAMHSNDGSVDPRC